jgi:hypothetical protein
MKRLSATHAAHRRPWGGVLVALALVAQWLLVVASTAHHAQALASGLPWAPVCSSAGSAWGTPAGDPASDPTPAGAASSACPVCSAAATPAAPSAAPAAPAAAGCTTTVAPAGTASRPFTPALLPPARAPPSV